MSSSDGNTLKDRALGRGLRIDDFGLVSLEFWNEILAVIEGFRRTPTSAAL